MILVTGGAGFIGSNFVLEWLSEVGEPLVNLDKLTYSGNLDNLSSVAKDARYTFLKGDIGDRHLIHGILHRFKPRAIVHLAAETHVDRSIHHPDPFFHTNVLGTFALLEETLNYWRSLSAKEKEAFRFLHVSTDEVYGALRPGEAAFNEKSRYAPNSPYSASKAASDHIVRSYFKTYGLPVVTSNCSNNYGPYQYPEKLIPLTILNAMQGKDLPVYGDGLQERNWLFVKDHCTALRCVLDRGTPGEVYLVGDGSSRPNIDVIRTICGALDDQLPFSKHRPHEALIRHIGDRPGHDRRYDIDASKLRTDLKWQPSVTFENGLQFTVEWYLKNREWVSKVMSGEYRDWMKIHYLSKHVSSVKEKKI